MTECATRPAAAWTQTQNVLITGGTGFIGSRLTQSLAGRCNVRRVSRAGAAPMAHTSGIEDITGDIRKPNVWKQLLRDVDVVFHLAAQTSAYTAMSSPAADLAANVLPLVHLLQTCRECEVTPTIVFAGAATQVGLTEQVPVDESLPDRPITVYDVHKLTAEHYLECFTRLGFVRGTTLRLANVYGPGPRSSSADRGVLNRMIRSAIQGEPLTVYGAGDQVRDYVFIDDVARAFLYAAEHIDATQGRHFVIGSGTGHTIVQAMKLVADRVACRTRRRVDVVHVDRPPGLSPIEDRQFVANTAAFAAATGWSPVVRLADGIDRTLAAFVAEAEANS